MKRKNGEGSYGEKNIKGVKYKYFRDTDGNYTYAKTAKELKEKIEKKKNDKKLTNKNNPVINKTYIFGDLCKEWLSSKYGKLTRRVYDTYDDIIRLRILPYKIADHQTRSLNADIIEKHLFDLKDKYSKSSINHTWNIIKQTIEYGMELGVVPEINLAKIDRPSENEVIKKKKEVPFITEGDMEILYQLAQSGIYGNAAQVIVFIMYSGLRVSEACALKWKYISSDYSTIQVKHSIIKAKVRDDNGNEIKGEDGKVEKQIIEKTTKTKSGNRTIPLPERGVNVLKYFDEKYPNHKQDDFVFLNSNKKSYDKDQIRKVLKRMVDHSECSNKNYTTHSLRHGYGSLLISKGVDIKIVSELLGHSNISTTYNIYIGVLREDKVKAVQSVFNIPKEPK